MMSASPYDVHVAFDDIYGAPAIASAPDEIAEAAERLLARCKKETLSELPPVEFEIVGADSTPWSFAVLGAPVLGSDVQRNLPLFNAIHTALAGALPQPKLVRIDTPETHEGFLDARREPYLKDLDARLRALEAAVAAHAADGHGGGRLARLEDAFGRHMDRYHGGDEDVLGAGVDAAAIAAVQVGQPIPLLLPLRMHGKVDCWQDGPEVVCAVRFIDPQGRKRVATSGAPLARSVDRVIRWATHEEVAPEALATLLLPLAQNCAGWDLSREICATAHGLCVTDGGLRALDGNDIIVGAARPAADARLVAAMALAQRCQRGDRRACAELIALAGDERELVERACGKLARAQREKASRR